MYKKFKYKIRGLDCSEEVSSLRKTVGILPGVKEMDFDILNAKMILNLDTTLTTEDKIRVAVKEAGLEAMPWNESHSCNTCTEETFWQKHKRFVICFLGGMFLLAGFLSHAIIHKSIFHALAAGEGMGKHSFPIITIVFYMVSMIFSVWYIAPKAFIAIKKIRLDMNFLMFIAMVGAVVIWQWLEAASVIFLFAVAQLLESWSIEKARRAISSLMELSPAKARYICPHDGDIEEKPVGDVPLGVAVLVRPGERIPLDGVVTKGSTSVNQSPITGESRPVSKQPGDEVFAGTINEDGAFEFKVTRVSDDTTLARIIRMIEESQSRRAPAEQWVEQFARYYTPTMISLAITLVFILPLFFNLSLIESFYRALVMLVISCPCALVISTPVSIVAGLASAARNGVLIKGGAYLESPAYLKVIALDKTGTITYGQPVVQNILSFNNHTQEVILKKAASLEVYSEHPLARAILKKAKIENITFTPAESFKVTSGKGAEAYIDGKPFWIGSYRLVEENHQVTLDFHQKAKELEKMGHSVVAIGNKDHVCGIISISDEVRKEALPVVKSLKSSGIKLVMLTGDNEGTAKSIADSIGINEFKAALLPEDKVKAVENLVKEFKSVAMIGDGVNDAPAMAASSLGIAMGGMGTDAAIESADIVLMSDDLSRLPWLIKHSRKTLAIVKQNILVALGLKLLFMGLAFTGIANLWMAIVADMGASLLVIFNALRLLRIDK